MTKREDLLQCECDGLSAGAGHQRGDIGPVRRWFWSGLLAVVELQPCAALCGLKVELLMHSCSV